MTVISPTPGSHTFIRSGYLVATWSYTAKRQLDKTTSEIGQECYSPSIFFTGFWMTDRKLWLCNKKPSQTLVSLILTAPKFTYEEKLDRKMLICKPSISCRLVQNPDSRYCIMQEMHPITFLSSSVTFMKINDPMSSYILHCQSPHMVISHLYTTYGASSQVLCFMQYMRNMMKALEGMTHLGSRLTMLHITI